MTFIFGVNMSLIDVKIKALEEEIATLKLDYEALKSQAKNALNPLERSRLDRQAEDLYQRGLAKEEELKKLKAKKAQQNPNKSHLNREQIAVEDPNLQSLTQYVTNLLGNDLNPVPKELIENLIKILNQLNHFERVAQAFLATFENSDRVSLDCSNKIAAIKDDNVNVLCKFFTLFKLLLEDYPHQSYLIQRVVDFSNFLQQENPEIRNELLSWLQKIKQYGYKPSRPSEPELIEPPTEAEKIDLIEAYLMILIRPIKPLSRRKFQVDSFFKIGSRWQEPPIPNQDNLTLKQVKTYVADLIGASLGLVQIEERKLNCNKNSMTVDFFMPWKYLDEKVDQWGRDLAGKEVPFGKDYKISVRLYERIAHLRGDRGEKNAPTYFEYWRAKWRTFEQFLAQNPNQKQVRDKFKCLVKSSEFKIEELEGDLGGEKIGIKLACNLPKSNKERFFGMVLRTGIPIALWVRQDKISGVRSLKKATDELLKPEYLVNLNLLLERIKEERKKAYDKNGGLGLHLAILCDDPTRLPPELPPMADSEPLISH